MYRDVLFNFHLNFGIPPQFVFQLEVYYKVDRLLTGLTAHQKGTTARWYLNKSSSKKTYGLAYNTNGYYF